VTGETEEAIINSELIKEKYNYYSAHTPFSYGCMILTKHPCRFFELEYDDSSMDRKLHIAEPLYSDKFIFATSHFESTATCDYERQSQMQ